jgi:hypothetical protein
MNNDEKQVAFLEALVEKYGEMLDLTEKLTFHIKDSKGNIVEIYLPYEDFKELLR